RRSRSQILRTDATKSRRFETERLQADTVRAPASPGGSGVVLRGSNANGQTNAPFGAEQRVLSCATHCCIVVNRRFTAWLTRRPRRTSAFESRKCTSRSSRSARDALG